MQDQRQLLRIEPLRIEQIGPSQFPDIDAGIQQPERRVTRKVGQQADRLAGKPGLDLYV